MIARAIVDGNPVGAFLQRNDTVVPLFEGNGKSGSNFSCELDGWRRGSLGKPEYHAQKQGHDPYRRWMNANHVCHR